MLTTEECPEMNVGTGKFSDDVEMTCRVDASTMYSGSEFQMEEVAAGKARLPTVDSLTNGTMRRLVAAERRFRRPGTSVETSRRRYENSCNYLHQ